MYFFLTLGIPDNVKTPDKDDWGVPANLTCVLPEGRKEEWKTMAEECFGQCIGSTYHILGPVIFLMQDITLSLIQSNIVIARIRMAQIRI